ncbi:hypothetical protein LP422_17485 [Janibacter limosus]|uniref:Uncharacterized protein n=1 Tax=Janibacter limosus TaxID=53458 RepID=A0AC61U2M9_9MICO|nr:hypothetical protein [Janibacter limosus]UUZ44263.1 hypothetical protein LP422_17485 [Janibacter limosus]
MSTFEEDVSASEDTPLTKWEERGIGCGVMVLVMGFPVAGALGADTATKRWYWAAIVTATLLWSLWEGLKAWCRRKRGLAEAERLHSDGASQ